jgi:hypothetical protein
MVKKLYLIGCFILISSCATSEKSSDIAETSDIPVPAVEATSQNKEVCRGVAQSKSPNESENMSETIQYYKDLASRSSGVLSTTFLLLVSGVEELASYREMNQDPPESVSNNLEGRFNLLGAMCTKLLESPSSDSMENTDSDQQDSKGGQAEMIPEGALPYRTERNQYWNANCPRDLRLNNSLPLVYCDMGEGVRHMQRLLNINADSYFGNTVFNAVLDFQFENGLPVTGDIDQQTWLAIDPYQTGPGLDWNDDGLVTPNEFDSNS